MPLMPIRGHPSGRGGSQALKTASLGRDGAGLEVPNSGIWELQKTSALVSLHLGRRRGTAAQGHGGKRQTWTQPRSLLFLTGEAASTQGREMAAVVPPKSTPFPMTVPTARWGDLRGSQGCPGGTGGAQRRKCREASNSVHSSGEMQGRPGVPGYGRHWYPSPSSLSRGSQVSVTSSSSPILVPTPEM